MSAAPMLLSSSRAHHPSSRPSSHPAAMASRFRTVAGLCLADEQPRAGCSGRLEFALLGGLRGGHAAGLQAGRAAGLRGGYAAEARTSAPGGLEKRLRIVRIQGDGRCLFRALVRPLPLPARRRLRQCHLCWHTYGATHHARLRLPGPAGGAAALGRAGPYKDGSPAAERAQRSAWPACRRPAPAFPARPRPVDRACAPARRPRAWRRRRTSS